MKVVLLTTDTIHHQYFASELSACCDLAAIVLETRSVAAPFETRHPFEDLRDEHERDALLKNIEVDMREIADTLRFESANDADAVEFLRGIEPEVCVVFGTGILGDAVISTPSVACLNLHGGNPEWYRGLDSHLWAIYHNDFPNLVTTLHHVDAGLDTGEIVMQEHLSPTSGSGLHELRAVNTKACVNLTALTVESLRSRGWLPSRPQVRRGAYYSFMPAELKEVVVGRYERYTSEL